MLIVKLLAVFALAFAGGWLGRRLARSRKPWWALGYAGGLGVVLLVLLGRRSVAASFHQPMEWITRTSVTYLAMAFAASLLLATLTGKLPRRGQRVAIWILLAVMVGYFSVMPVVLPWIVLGQLQRTPTIINGQGDCVQNHEYTCGPAAAVTALRHLGVRAEEGELSIAAGTAPAEGTDPRDLAAAIERLHGAQQVSAAYRWFDDLDKLGQAVPVVVSVSWDGLMHHYITVLEIRPREVSVADPLRGRWTMTRDEFARIWNHAGVAVWRNPRLPETAPHVDSARSASTTLPAPLDPP